MAISANRSLALRPVALGLGKLLMLSFSRLPLVSAAPTSHLFATRGLSETQALPVKDASLWLYLGVAAALVLAGGAFAGLTIALMGQVCLLNPRLLPECAANSPFVPTDRMKYIYKSFRPQGIVPTNEKMRTVYYDF